MRLASFCLAFFLALNADSLAALPAVTADVVVYGATPAGIAAALAAGDGGTRTVLLVEPTPRIGGMTTHGLSHSDFHSFESINGAFDRFRRHVLQYYEQTYGQNSDQVKDSWRGTHGEPKVNLLVFQQMLADCPSVKTLTEHRLIDVTVIEDSITALQFNDRDGNLVDVTPRMVIDATYEGDLMAAARVPFRVGREARSEYNEPLAPETGDGQLQGYNFRLCMTQKQENRVPIPIPPDYDRNDYVGVIPLVTSGAIKAAFGYPGRPFLLKAHLPVMPNGKHDINDVSKGAARLSRPGTHLEFPNGDRATRRRIEQEHLDWQLGLIHFAQTDHALPDAFRAEAATWGLCRDEFTESGNIPAQIYVREARRMIGKYIYTETDTQYAADDARAKRHEDAIAMGEYSHNCHGTDHEGPMIGGRHTGEFYKGVAPYQIPYGVLIPRAVNNLFVPVACSASHVGFCALRLESIWMSLGEAAGVAADQAIARRISVQQVDVTSLQRTLWKRGAATIYVSDVSPQHKDFVAVQWWGSVGGLHSLEPAPRKPGARGAHIVSQYYEAYPGHAVQLEKTLSAVVADRWRDIARRQALPLQQLPPANGQTTRGQWIHAAYNAWQKSIGE